ncbi:endonuclease NucS domain-containing protein [Bradyrhizobium campsiandrae]|uniref:DUF91 domain-containing protein n=1 Tax=Bradyrhizobium campsiandrae TaxID=1729892 RepID=A0ABR7TY73_9BRAD|nr:endonuclease NucS domain-containing protein [Bradyrhizobium campsiandrae]MBC9976804.1 DUF91 domain-containing protein [Bradyrhizobium campsiandrae]
MIRLQEFKDYCRVKQGLAPNTISQYSSYITRIDALAGGLEEAIERDGVDKLIVWGKEQTSDPFHLYPSAARAILNRYIQFYLDKDSAEVQEEEELVQEAEQSSGLAFRLEKEMHAAVRRQLSNIEAGLVEEGAEVQVDTGFIDILARDSSGKLVVIELKAGKCPAGAMEQALGYAQALSDQRKEPARVLLIASEFSDRIRAAAKRTVDFKLLTYEFSLKFAELK